ncbi:MAG: hypothetical protein FWC56_02105 [Phycisphaerae bacterium]|nr:hypothetical protein [Phycisphaerae bacterium]
MSDRRRFLKQVAMLGAVATTPVSFALGQAQPVAKSAAKSAAKLAEKSATEPLAEPTEGLFAVSYEQIVRDQPPRKISIPDVDGFKVLKGDFHMHTVFSDGDVIPRDRVAEAVDNGFDVISITDHIEVHPNFGGNGIKLLDKNDDHNMAYDLAKPEADAKKLILVRGTEITKMTMPPGHFNALFIQDANSIAAVVDDWKKMLAVATDQGGFVQWNHPGWVSPKYGGLQPGQPMHFTKEHEEVYRMGHLHGIEIFNGVSYFPVVSQWCKERNLAMICNSDVHSSEWNVYGHQNPLRPMTLVFAKERSHDSIREAFFANRTAAFVAGMILGRQEWLEKLFAACVTVTPKPGILELTNKSDLPCLVQAGGATRELPAMGRLSIDRNESLKKLTVSNWLVSMNQPLEIAVG